MASTTTSTSTTTTSTSSSTTTTSTTTTIDLVFAVDNIDQNGIQESKEGSVPYL